MIRLMVLALLLLTPADGISSDGIRLAPHGDVSKASPDGTSRAGADEQGLGSNVVVKTTLNGSSKVNLTSDVATVDSPNKMDVLHLATKEARLLFAQFTTSTRNALSIITSTTLYTCLLATSGNACAGRRRKQLKFLAKNLQDLGKTLRDRDDLPLGVGRRSQDETQAKAEPQLYSSVLPSEDVEGDLSSSRRKAKTLLTVWTTVSTTSTVTEYATNTATTVTIAELCSFASNTLSLCAR